MPQVSITPQNNSNFGSLAGIYPIFCNFADAPVIGAEKWSDGTSNTHGTLYPTSFRTVEQTVLNTMITSIKASFVNDNGIYAVDETKNKVLGEYVSRYKKLKTLQLRQDFSADINTTTDGVVYSSSVGNSVYMADNLVARYRYNTSLNKTYLEFFNYNDDGTFTKTTYSGQVGNSYHRLIKLSATKVLLQAPGYNFYVISFVTGTITVGAAFTPSFTHTGICRADDDKFAMSYNGSGYGYATVCTVSGTTITAGTQQQIVYPMYNTLTVFEVGVNKIMFMYQPQSGQPYKLKAATIVGTVMTLGSEFENPLANPPTVICLLEADKIVLNYGYDLVLVTLSGTNITTSKTTIPSGLWQPSFMVQSTNTEFFMSNTSNCQRVELSGTTFLLKERTIFPSSASGDYFYLWYIHEIVKLKNSRIVMYAGSNAGGSPIYFQVMSKVECEVRLNGTLVLSPSFWFSTDSITDLELAPTKNYIAIKNLITKNALSISKIICEVK